MKIARELAPALTLLLLAALSAYLTIFLGPGVEESQQAPAGELVILEVYPLGLELLGRYSVMGTPGVVRLSIVPRSRMEWGSFGAEAPCQLH